MMGAAPDRWVPTSLRPGEERPEPDPMYGVGVETAPGKHGMTDGPFPELEQALEVVPEDTGLPTFVFLLPGDNRLYKWANDSWVKLR